ncbi:cation-dependent mannose-6-phosphate receptor-like [Branchiostoma floridae]|uniref:Cation-dependent mannose-6-phosphate receptor-like n=1 Tax=Branchiostoma floridae TaxID=7739 RepID=A0A9J7NC49_BRAFL|nr:cation-dependent mannose-6-phosphate receptor-like [Branchiostoma floridae]
MQYMLALFAAASLVARIAGDCVIDTAEGLQDKEKKLLERLAPLTKANQLFKFRDNPYNYEYKARICNPVESSKPDAGIIQVDRNGSAEHSLGMISKVNIKAGNNWMMLEYRGGDKYHSHCNGLERTSIIMILCDSSTVEGTMSIIEEHTRSNEEDCYYLFELYSNVVCSAKSSIPGGLSVGSVLVLIFVVVVGCYFLFGFLYQRFVVGAKGMEQIPHFSFWKDFGNLQADGCELVCRTQEAGPPRTYKGIGDDQLGLDDDDERDDHLLPM